jgi:hypothetical protein
MLGLHHCVMLLAVPARQVRVILGLHLAVLEPGVQPTRLAILRDGSILSTYDIMVSAVRHACCHCQQHVVVIDCDLCDCDPVHGIDWGVYGSAVYFTLHCVWLARGPLDMIKIL